MSWNSKDSSFLGSDGMFDFPEASVSLKSILSSKRQSLWLFPRRKKRVKFAELELKLQSGTSTQTREKWRKYVAEQFKTLRSRKRKRDRWLGRAPGKNKQRNAKLNENISSSAGSSMGEPGVSQSNGLEDSFSSQDQLQIFEIPEPDHKKRKKTSATRCGAKRKRSGGRVSRRTSRTRAKKKRSRSKTAMAAGLVQDGGDPNSQQLQPAIKQPPNAFLIFAQCCRQEFKDLMVPAFDNRVVSMVLGHVWRFLSKPERQRFYEEAENQRQQYYKEKMLLSSQSAEPAKNDLKKPLNAFMLFCLDQRLELQPRTTALSGSRAVRTIARKWKKLKPSEKKVYIERARKEKSEYSMKKKESESFGLFSSGDKEDKPGTSSASDSALKTAASMLLKKMGKNNNKWLTDSSDTDGSRANSATQVKPERDDATTASASPDCHKGSSPRQSHAAEGNSQTEPGAGGTKGNAGDVGSRVDESASKTKDAGLAVCVHSSESSETSGSTFNCHTRRQRGKRSKKKRMLRKRSISGKQVHWKDDYYPWDTLDPVSSVLCDEDICTHLCEPPVFSRDDSCLQQAPSYLYPPACCLSRSDSACHLHSSCWLPPSSSECRKHGFRQDSSCSPQGPGRGRVKAAFLKLPGGETFTSSSSSSDFDTCPFAKLPPVSPSSSCDSCLPYRFSNFHISNHTTSPCSSSSHADSSTSCLRGRPDLRTSQRAMLPAASDSYNNSQRTEGTANSIRSLSHCGNKPAVARRQHCQCDLNSSYSAAPDKSTLSLKNRMSHLSRSECRSCSSPDCPRHCISASAPSHETSPKVELSGVLPGNELLHPSLLPGETSLLQESCSASSAGPKDADATHGGKTECSSPSLESNTDSVQCKCVDSSAGLDASPALNDGKEAKGSPPARNGPANTQSSDPAQCEACVVQELAAEGLASQIRGALDCDEDVHSGIETEGSRRESPTASNVSNPIMSAHAKWMQALDQCFIPRSVHLEMDPESHGRLDCMGLNRGTFQFPYLFAGSFDVPGLFCLPSVMSDELLGLCGTGSVVLDEDLCTSLKTRSNSSGEAGFVSGDPEKEKPVPENNLKRKVSYDSLEVVNSSNNFSESTRPACSLPKYAFTADRSFYGHQSSRNVQAESDFKDNYTNSQPPKHPKMLVQIPLDLEVEFCERRGWIQ